MSSKRPRAASAAKHKPKAPKKAREKSGRTDVDANPDAHWAKMEPYLDKASKEQVEELARNLFGELWRRNGKGPATAAAKPFWEEIRNDAKKNLGAKGTWELKDNSTDEDVGTLTIYHRISYAEFKSSDCEAELHLESSESAGTLLYRGDTDQWENCRDDFKVELSMSYDPDSNAIQGKIDVSPYRIVDYGPPSAYGGGFSFVGSREGADDEDEDDEEEE